MKCLGMSIPNQASPEIPSASLLRRIQNLAYPLRLENVVELVR